MDLFNTQVSKQRNKTLDVYKGLLIILVIVRHVLQYSTSDEGGVLTNYIWAVQMPGFMLISGYFAFREIVDISAAKQRLCSATQHYALPFFSWFLLIDVICLGRFDRSPLVGLKELSSHVDYGLWFLWVIFCLSIIGTIINYCIHTSKLKAAAIFAVFFTVLISIGLRVGFNYFGIKYIVYYALFYFFGWLIKSEERTFKELWDRFKSVILTVSLISFILIIHNYDLYHSEDTLIAIAMRCVAGFTGNAILLNVSMKYKTALSKLKVDTIGRYTLELYATHVYVCGLMKPETSFFTTTGFVNFCISLLLTICFTTIIIVVFKSIAIINKIMYGKTK